MSILSRFSKGQAMIIAILAMPALIAALALTCDMGVMYANHIALQRSADAAVLSGAGWLPDDVNRARNTATSYLTNNNILGAEVAVQPTVRNTVFNNDSIDVTLQRTVPHLFGRVIGINSANVRVYAKAKIQSVAGAGGSHLMPVGFLCASPPCGLVQGDFIPLPGESTQGVPGQSKLAPGDWGGLRLPDEKVTGKKAFTDAVANGDPNETIMTSSSSGVQADPGNYVNPATQDGMDARYLAGTQGTTGPFDPNDSRVIEIPMVESWPGGSHAVNITGFITALIVPDGTGSKNNPSYKAMVISIALSHNVPDPNNTSATGPFVPVLIQ